MPSIKYGLEVECQVRSDITQHWEIGNYHEGKPISQNWTVEQDGSLANGSASRGVEIVSRQFVKEELKEIVEELKHNIEGDHVDDDFNKISIDSSCGAHIHFSVRSHKTFHFFDKIPIKFFTKIRKMAFHRIQSELPKVYPTFAEHYFRSYAQKMKPRNLYSNMGGYTRYTEFHFTRDAGVEWRSFNLLGVKNWKDFEKMYQIALDCIESVFMEEWNKSMCFENVFRVIVIVKQSVDNEQLSFEISLKDEEEEPFQEEIMVQFNEDSY